MRGENISIFILNASDLKQTNKQIKSPNRYKVNLPDTSRGKGTEPPDFCGSHTLRYPHPGYNTQAAYAGTFSLTRDWSELSPSMDIGPHS